MARLPSGHSRGHKPGVLPIALLHFVTPKNLISKTHTNAERTGNRENEKEKGKGRKDKKKNKMEITYISYFPINKVEMCVLKVISKQSYSVCQLSHLLLINEYL